MSSKGNNGGGGGGGNGFKPLGLSHQVFQGIVRMGFRTPTPVQRKALPVVMSGADSVVMARTGSGKTAAFLIPLMETLLASQNDSSRTFSTGVRGVVLSPTRELSLQTLRVFKKMSHFTDIKSIGIHGGERMDQQFDDLSSKPDVIIATPGRLSHILSEIPDFNLRECQLCVLDEADRLLEMGFAQQLREINRSIPERCQKVLLSATMPKMLIEFTKGGFTTDPQMVRLDAEVSCSEELRLSFITCRSMEKDAGLLQIMEAIQDDKETNPGTRTGLTLVFCATRHHVEYVANLLRASGQDATMIYGTLDPDARNSNLAAFRAGRKPIMVVTDVAARGVDIPMCDHVVHYHFPPSPKLFVHRSGRVARAGRIGFCFALVEPDELPYMVDLHLFLGRRLCTADGVTNTNNKIETGVDTEKSKHDHSDDGTQAIESYTMNEMTPEMTHYGSIPESILTLEVENVRRIMDSEMAGTERAELMRSLTRVCNNAMKQYRRTRPEASREGVRRAKTILEGQKLRTGQRIGGASISSHPLLRGLEIEQYERARSKGKIGTLNTLDNLKKRNEFLKALSQFRPKETVFEAFATGGGKEMGVLGQVDKGRTIATSKKNDSSYAMTSMKNMRRQMRMVRDKGTTLVVAGSEVAQENREDDENDNKMNGEEEKTNRRIAEEKAKTNSKPVKVIKPIVIESKARMSKAERRRLKKNPDAAPSTSNNNPQYNEKRQKNMRGRDFRDESFFIENEFASNSEESQRQRRMEAAMQPSAANSVKGITGNAMRLEEAMLDVVGDENDQLIKKQRMMRWDKSKRKYVQTSVGAELSGTSYSKRVKLESGQIVKKDKLKLGEIYEKWQKKTNRSVGRNGVFDNDGMDGDDDVVPNSSSKHRQGGKKKGGKNRDGEDGPVSAKTIKQNRDNSQNKKMKNMVKSDRRRLEKKDKTESNAAMPSKKGHQGKKGMSGRWKK